MHQQTNDHPELIRRVEALERANRRLRRLGALLMALAGGAAVMGQGAPARVISADRIETSQLVLKGRTGVECAWLKLDAENAPTLMLKKGTAHATLSLSNAMAGLACGTRDGVSWIGATPDGPNVNFRGSNLKTGAWLGIDRDLNVGLHMYGETLKVGAMLRLEADGSPSLRLTDANGNEKLIAP